MGFGHDFERDPDGRVEDLGLGPLFYIAAWITMAAAAATAIWYFWKGST